MITLRRSSPLVSIPFINIMNCAAGWIFHGAGGNDNALERSEEADAKFPVRFITLHGSNSLAPKTQLSHWISERLDDDTNSQLYPAAQRFAAPFSGFDRS